MQQKTLYRSLVMKLEDVTQANEEIDEVVPQERVQCTVEQRVVVPRTSSRED